MAKRKPLSAPVAVETGQTNAAELDRRRKAGALRRVAVERANTHGGRPSVSRVIVELVEASQAELEGEL